MEQKDQAIDALTMQVSQHIGAIAELHAMQEQMAQQISDKDSAIQQLEKNLEQERKESQQQLLQSEKRALLTQQQHTACVSEYESTIAQIQSSSALQLQQERDAAAEAAAPARQRARRRGDLGPERASCDARGRQEVGRGVGGVRGPAGPARLLILASAPFTVRLGRGPASLLPGRRA